MNYLLERDATQPAAQPVDLLLGIIVGGNAPTRGPSKRDAFSAFDLLNDHSTTAPSTSVPSEDLAADCRIALSTYSFQQRQLGASGWYAEEMNVRDACTSTINLTSVFRICK